MNVQRDVYGHLMPADFSGVLHLPHPVPMVYRNVPPAAEWGVQPYHSSYVQTTDIERTDFHAQRMETVR